MTRKPLANKKVEGVFDFTSAKQIDRLKDMIVKVAMATCGVGPIV